MYTKDNPGCFHSMIQYLSTQSGISQRREIVIKDMDRLYNRKGRKRKLLYKSWDITVVTKDGSMFQYMQQFNKRFDQCGIVANHFLVSVYRNTSEFGLEIQPAGKYKDCLGGGWYSMTELVKVNDQYFAPNMECTC